jgi:hypothetical protein
MRGGTNFEPLAYQCRPRMISFVGLSRTRTEAACNGNAVYHPELVILTTDREIHYLDYTSEALHFGSSILEEQARKSICDGGRILTPLSISKIDGEDDILTGSFSVADSTVQFASIKGFKLSRISYASLVPMLGTIQIWKGTSTSPWMSYGALLRRLLTTLYLPQVAGWYEIEMESPIQ